VPILDELGEWISKIGPQTEPGSAFGKAMYYAATHWEKLNVYVSDGSLEIDNNLVENQIRPIAVGRKGYLFAGSHKAAQRAAMFYTLAGNCKLHGVNPVQWIEHIIRNIMTAKYNDVPSLYPQNYKSSICLHAYFVVSQPVNAASIMAIRYLVMSNLHVVKTFIWLQSMGVAVTRCSIQFAVPDC